MPADVVAATGLWERYAGVAPAVPRRAGRLRAHPLGGRPAPSGTALEGLIERAGPLWVSASPPGEHAVVVSGVTGDGTSSGSMLDIVDPWAPRMTTFGSPNPGSTYHQSLVEFLAGIAGGAGNPVVIAQLKRDRPDESHGSTRVRAAQGRSQHPQRRKRGQTRRPVTNGTATDGRRRGGVAGARGRRIPAAPVPAPDLAVGRPAGSVSASVAAAMVNWAGASTYPRRCNGGR